MELPNIRKLLARPRKLTGPNGLKLKQIAYRAFPHDITLYHFQGNHASVHNLRIQLNRPDHGYVDTLLSSDPILSLKTPLPEHDIVPKGRIEVAYMPDVFHLGGSALGFRMDKGVVQWMCFDQPIDHTILQKTLSGKPRNDDSMMLFDHVGTLGKTVQDYTGTYRTSEHRGWHHSLGEAYHRPLKLNLMWRSLGKELKADLDARRAEHAREKVEQDLTGLGSKYDGFARNNRLTTTGDNTNEKEQGRTNGLLHMHNNHVTVGTLIQEIIFEDEDMNDGMQNIDTRSKMPHPRRYMSPSRSDLAVLGD